MGKKRLKTIDLSQKEEKKPPKKVRPETSVKISAKQHGRLKDMGAIMLEEMEKVEEKEKIEEATVLASPAKKEKKKVKKPSQPQKIRSKRFQKIKKMIKPEQLYPLPEAIELLKKTANAGFVETVELHLIVARKGKLTKAIKTEAKAPLVHLKIGKVSEPAKKLAEKIQELLKPVPSGTIKKAVLKSTMGPAIKINLSL